jgi:hypothetical protein
LRGPNLRFLGRRVPALAAAAARRRAAVSLLRRGVSGYDFLSSF